MLQKTDIPAVSGIVAAVVVFHAEKITSINDITMHPHDWGTSYHTRRRSVNGTARLRAEAERQIYTCLAFPGRSVRSARMRNRQAHPRTQTRNRKTHPPRGRGTLFPPVPRHAPTPRRACTRLFPLPSQNAKSKKRRRLAPAPPRGRSYLPRTRVGRRARHAPTPRGAGDHAVSTPAPQREI